MQFSGYAVPTLLSAMTSMALVIYLQRSRRMPAVRPLTITLLFTTGYAFNAALVILSSDLAAKMFWANLRLSCAAFISVFLLATAVEFNRRGQKLPRETLAALSIIPALTAVLALTSSPLIYYNRHVEAPYPFLVESHGTWFWIYLFYSYALEGAAFFSIAYSARKLPPSYAFRHRLFLFGMLIPVCFDFLGIFGIFPGIPGLNLSPSILPVSFAIVGYAIVRYRLFDIAPAARHKVVETMQEGVIISDDRQMIVDVNPAASQVLYACFPTAGRPLIGQSIQEMVGDTLAWGSGYAADQPVAVEVTLKSGEAARLYGVRIVPLVDPRGRRNGHVTLLNDITEQKRADKLLRDREERFRLMVEVIPFPLILTSTVDHTLLYINQEGARLIGLSQEEAVGQPVPDFYDSPADREKLIAELYERGSLNNKEVLFKRANGERFWALLSATITEFRDEPVFLAGINDITARRRAEEQALEIVIEREKIKVLESFIQNTSHDLKTPITVMTATAYLFTRLIAQMEQDIAALRTAEPPNPAYDRLADSVSQLHKKTDVFEGSAYRLAQIVDSMLEITRLELQHQYTFAVTDLNALIETTVQQAGPAAAQKSLTLTFESDPALPTLPIDRSQWQKVMDGLLDNALRYTPEHGAITVQTRVADSQAIITVSDTGIGITETDLSQIFTPFYRADKARSTSTGGAGLGLAIIKRIVEAHGGTIDVHSRVGQGTLFRIDLPLKAHQG